ncbi:MAG: MFS transporter [Nocardiopsaceae bacterium]|nr:MFS transporter [Nocardiopsaceae bacterium]
MPAPRAITALPTAARRGGATVVTYFGLSGDGGSSPRGERKRSTSWRVLGNPAFRRYFSGCVTSDLGTWLANTAQLLLAYRLSHSVLVIGLVTCAQFSSPLLLGPWAGVMTDRHGGRRMLLATQLLGAVCATAMACLVLTGLINEWWLTGGAIASGIAFTLALPARNVTVRRLVRERDVEPAFAMDSVSYNLGRAVGPPLTVTLVMLFTGTAGFGWAFAANAVSFLVFAVCLMRAGGGSPERIRSRPRRSGLRAGLAAARDDWHIAVLLAMVAAVTMADDPVLVLGPTLARQPHVLDDLPGWLAQWLTPASLPGLFIAALGAGTVLGSLRPSRHKTGLRVPAVALASLAACMMVFVFSPLWWISMAAAAGAGFTCLIANSSTRTFLSKEAGPAKEASVMVVWAIAWAGSKPVASLADGTIADSLGVRWAGILLALPALVPVLALTALLISVYVAPRLERRSRRHRHQAPRPRHRIATAPARWLGAFWQWLITPAYDRAYDLLGAPAPAATAEEAP